MSFFNLKTKKISTLFFLS